MLETAECCKEKRERKESWEEAARSKFSDKEQCEEQNNSCTSCLAAPVHRFKGDSLNPQVPLIINCLQSFLFALPCL